jgi:lambda family phage portal protein
MSRPAVSENLIDRLVRYVDPVAARRRQQARVHLALSESYVGASTTRRAMKNFNPGSGDADADTLRDLPTLRARSRDLVRNAPIATGAINTVVTNAVGTGLALHARPDRAVLGLTDEEAEAWESDAEREFRLWSESTECDVSGQSNLRQLMSLAFRSTLENGDALALLPRIRTRNFPYSLKVQLIEADRLSTPTTRTETDRLVSGIEKDENGRAVRYHISKFHPGAVRRPFSRAATDWTAVEAVSASGLRNVLHLMDRRRIGQTRGTPYLAPVIEPLKQLDRYSEAEIMAAVVSGLFTVFVQNEAGSADLLNLETGGTTDTAADQVAADEIKLGSGAVVGLAPGESINTANPGRPNAAFDPFVQAILRQVGVALEIPFEILIKHFTSSYSAARAALLEAWRFFSGRRAWLVDSFCQPVYEAFLYEAVALGRLPAPGFFQDPLIRMAWCGSEWTGPARGMIDETKEVDAARMRVELGISTLAEETSAITGGDWEAKHRQRAKEARMRREAGLEPSLSTSPKPAVEGESTPPTDPFEENEETP